MHGSRSNERTRVLMDLDEVQRDGTRCEEMHLLRLQRTAALARADQDCRPAWSAWRSRLWVWLLAGFALGFAGERTRRSYAHPAPNEAAAADTGVAELGVAKTDAAVESARTEVTP